MRFVVAATLLIGSISSPAQAEWLEARTDHFVLKIDDSEANARAFATRLERFDAALRRLYAVPDHPDQHARPIAIYAFDTDLFLETCGCPSVLGYYQAKPRSSVIFSRYMPEVDRKAKRGGWSSQTVLLHEYSHHFAFSNFPIAYPYWFMEGFAEFNATAEFEEDGSVLVGLPANYRGPALKDGSLSSKKLFETLPSYNDNSDLVYGRSWLLTNLLMLKQERNGQLANYLDAVQKGRPSIEAAAAAFGDLKKLDAELDSYARGYLAPPLRIAPSARPIEVRIRKMSPGEAAMLPTYGLLMSGIRTKYEQVVANRAAGVAKKFPEDAIVQSQWAEAEIHAGRTDRADQAADAALRLEADLVEPMIVKGLAAVQRLIEAKSRDSASWAAARGWFLKANRVDPNAVLPLYHYYRSFIAADTEPTGAAAKGLMRAHVLAPEDSDIRMMLAKHMLLSGDGATARTLLQPIAFAPHRKRAENPAKDVIELIDAGKLEEAKAVIKAGKGNNDDES